VTSGSSIVQSTEARSLLVAVPGFQVRVGHSPIRKSSAYGLRFWLGPRCSVPRTPQPLKTIQTLNMPGGYSPSGACSTICSSSIWYRTAAQKSEPQKRPTNGQRHSKTLPGGSASSSRDPHDAELQRQRGYEWPDDEALGCPTWDYGGASPLPVPGLSCDATLGWSRGGGWAGGG
jgi:hypothetical protein